MNALTAAFAVFVVGAASCTGVDRAPATEVRWQRIEVENALGGHDAAVQQAVNTLTMPRRMDGIEFMGRFEDLLGLGGYLVSSHQEKLDAFGIVESGLPWTFEGDRYVSRWAIDSCLVVDLRSGFEPMVIAVLEAAGIPSIWGTSNVSVSCYVPRRLVPAARRLLQERGLREPLFSYPELPIAPELSDVPKVHRQSIVVRPLARGSHRAEVEAFERAGEDAPWHSVQPPVPAVIGRAGAIWPEQKREGDGATPGGMHLIGPAFGYAPTLASRLRYRQATADDWWVDDPASPDYNTWVTGKPACSAEAMRRDDDQYELGAVLGWNTDPVEPGRGSAIFLHVWKGPDEPTSGCVALARDYLAALLRWLDADRSPVLVVAWPPGGW